MWSISNESGTADGWARRSGITRASGSNAPRLLSSTSPWPIRSSISRGMSAQPSESKETGSQLGPLTVFVNVTSGAAKPRGVGCPLYVEQRVRDAA